MAIDPPKSICKCGTCLEAIDVARRLFTQGIKAGDCILWQHQVATALFILADQVLVEAGESRTPLRDTITAHFICERIDPVEIYLKAKESSE